MDIFGWKQIALLQNQLTDLQTVNKDLSLQFKSRADLANNLQIQAQDLELRLKVLEKDLSKAKSNSSTATQQQSLEKEITELKKEIMKEAKIKTKLESLINELKHEKDVRGKEIQHLSEKIAAETKKIQDLEQLYKERKEQNAEIFKEKDQIKGQLEEKVQNLAVIKEEKEKIQKELKEIEVGVESEKKKLTESVAKAENQRKIMIDEKENLKKDLKAASEKKKNIEKSLTDKADEIEIEKQSTQKLRIEIQAITTEIQKTQSLLEQERKSIAAEKQALQTKIHESETLAKEAENNLAKLTATTSTASETINQLQTQLKIATAELLNSKTAQTHSESVFKSAEDTLSQLEGEKSKLESEFEVLTKAKEALKAEIAQQSSLIQISNTQNLQLDEKLTQTSADLVASQEKLRSLSVQFQDSENKIAELREKTENLHKKHEKSPELVATEEKIKALELRFHDSEKILHQLRAENEELQKKPELNEPDTDYYDAILDFDTFYDIGLREKGWKLITNEVFLHTDPAIVCSILGKHDSGKSFLLKSLLNTHSSDKKSETKHLSFKKSQIAASSAVFVDTVGFGSPFTSKSYDNTEKKLYENVVNSISYNISQHLILVVNEFSHKEKKKLKEIMFRLKKHKGDGHKSVIVVHNFRTVSSHEQLQVTWNNQVVNYFQMHQHINPESKQIDLVLNGTNRSQNVDFIKKNNTIHCALVNNNSEHGAQYNLFVLEFIKNRIVHETEAKPFGLVESVKKSVSAIIGEPNLVAVGQGHEHKIFVESCEFEHFKDKVNELSINSFFEPHFEILVKDGKYLIELDVPGMVKEEIKVECEKGKVKVSGSRKAGHGGLGVKRFGEFLSKFKIPQSYKPVVEKVKVKNGVMVLSFGA